jgi:hypothetical protein
MCLAIYKPKGLTIPKESLMSGYASNRSGCGFLYHEKGKLHHFKKLVSFTEFYEQYLQIEKDHDVAVHFRAATHGPRNDANCHPFLMCGGKFGMIHNGIFHIPMMNRDLSDTGNYCEMVLEPAIKDGSYKDRDRLFADNRWGWGCVVLMGESGEVIIYNEKMGHWNKGVWYSNGGYTNFSAKRYGVVDEKALVPYDLSRVGCMVGWDDEDY